MPKGKNRLPKSRLVEVLSEKKKVLEIKRPKSMEKSRIISPKLALKTAVTFLNDATKRNSNNSTKFFHKLKSSKSTSSFAIFGFGGRNINRGAFVQRIESILKGDDLTEVKRQFERQFSKLTRYSLADLVELSGSPLLGSRGTAKVEVTKKNGVNNVVLLGAAVPSFKRNSTVVERNKRFLYENLINNVRRVYGKKTNFTIRIPKEDSRIASYLESKFVIEKTESMPNIISLTIDLSKTYKRKKGK